MFSEFQQTEQPRKPERKESHRELDVAFLELKKNRSDKTWDAFFEQFRSFAETDLNFGSAYLKEFIQKADKEKYDYHVSTIRDKMLSIVAIYDPELAMRVQRQNIETKGYSKKVSELAKRWSQSIVSWENAESISANIQSHTPNPDLAEMYEDKAFRIDLNNKIIAQAKVLNDPDRALEIMASGEYGDIPYTTREFLEKAMVERMKAHESETDLQAIEKLAEGGLIARLANPTEHSYEYSFDLDTCNQQQLDKLSDEALKKIIKRAQGALKETLEEEFVLRVAKTNPEAVLDPEHAHIVQRNGVKTLLYGAISDQSILDRLGKPAIPDKYRGDQQRDDFFNATASRHLDLAASAAQTLHDKETIQHHLTDLEGNYMAYGVDRMDKALLFAYQNFRRHPEEGAECLEKIMINLRGRSNIEAEYPIMQQLAKRHPESAVPYLRRFLYEGRQKDPWVESMSKLPEKFFEKGLAVMDEDDPSLTLKRLQHFFKDKKQLRTFVLHLKDYPPELVDDFFALHFQIEKDGSPKKKVNPSEEEDWTLLWNGVTKEDPQFELMHKQLVRKYGEEGTGTIEKLIMSPKLELIRSNLNEGESSAIRRELIRKAELPENTIELDLNMLANLAEAFGKIKTLCVPDDAVLSTFSNSQDFDALGATILRSYIKGAGEMQRLQDIFSDRRIPDTQKKWGSSIALVLLRSATREETTVEECYAFLNDPRLEIFGKMVSEKDLRKIVLNCIDRFNLTAHSELLDVLARPELPFVLSKLPWFTEIVSNMSYNSDHDSLGRVLDEVIENQTPEELVAIAAKHLTMSIYFSMYKEFANYDAASLSKAMEEKQVPWHIMAQLPPQKIEEFRDVLMRVMHKPEEEGGPALANKALIKLMERIIQTPERYATELHDLTVLDASLEEMRRNGFSEEGNYYANQSIDAQEEISNKHLKTKIRKIFLRNSHAFDEVFVKSVPKDAVISLPLLDRWLTKEKQEGEEGKPDSSELQRFAQVFYTGQVFKKRTDLDRFNYFLLEAIDHEVNRYYGKSVHDKSMRELFENATRIMEQTGDAKKRFFAITQKIRSLGFLDQDAFQTLIPYAAIELKSLASISDEEVAEYEVGWRKDLEDKISTLRTEGSGIDGQTEEGAKQLRKLEKKIAEVQKKLDGGYKSAQALEEKQKKINESLDRLIKSLDDQLVETFEEKCGIALTQEEIIKLFEKFKEPGNLFVYLGKLKESQDGKQFELFKKYLSSIAQGTFPAVRYTGERKHLDIVFGEKPEDEAKWKELISFKTIHTAESEKGRTARKRMESFVREAVAHKHVEGTVADLMDAFLNETSEKRKEVALALEADVTEMENDPSAEEKQKDSVVALKLMKLFNKSAGEIKQDPEVDVLLKDLREAFKEDHPFANDIAAIIGVVDSMRQADVKKGEQEFVVVEETEDPDLMLRLGTDVAGSCQRIDGTPSLNRNLISYIMDGKIKVLIVRDSTNVILGRALLRVLFDEETQRPVLQLEKSYHRDGSSAQANGELLVKIAEERAQKMGYTLVGTTEYRNNKRPNFHHDLQSYRGPGSAEYVDSGGGARGNGTYAILADSHVVIREAEEEKPSE